MATRRIGLSKGEVYTNITEAAGAATVSDDVEITVDIAVYPKASDRSIVVERIEHLLNYVKTAQKWPPV